MKESLKVGPGKGRSLALMRRDTIHNRRGRKRMKGWEGRRYGGDWVKEDRERDIKSCAIYAKIISCALQNVQESGRKITEHEEIMVGKATHRERKGRGRVQRRKVSRGGRGKDGTTRLVVLSGESYAAVRCAGDNYSRYCHRYSRPR